MKFSPSRPTKQPSARRKAAAADEHPEADVRHVVRGIVRRGLQPVPAKVTLSLRVDQDVLEWFKAQGPDYQARMNAVLRAFKDASAGDRREETPR
jgi:uncharacterized protein (DUF4415 family)